MKLASFLKLGGLVTKPNQDNRSRSSVQNRSEQDVSIFFKISWSILPSKMHLNFQINPPSQRMPTERVLRQLPLSMTSSVFSRPLCWWLELCVWSPIPTVLRSTVFHGLMGMPPNAIHKVNVPCIESNGKNAVFFRLPWTVTPPRTTIYQVFSAGFVSCFPVRYGWQWFASICVITWTYGRPFWYWPKKTFFFCCGFS